MSGAIRRFVGEHAFLSNFHPAEIVWHGAVFPTSEHLYQALKAGSDGEREWVRTAPTPAEAKFRARTVSMIPGWRDGGRIDAMRAALKAKFAQHPELAAMLVATDDAELVEGNAWRDRFWGVDSNGEGENHLGRLLMEIRAALAKERCEDMAKPEPTMTAILSHDFAGHKKAEPDRTVESGSPQTKRSVDSLKFL